MPVSENMKTKIFLLTFLLSVFLFTSISLAGISCDPCTVGNCKCTITDFSSGTFGAYFTSDCSGFPPDYMAFSGGNVTWSPSQAGTYYLKACSDGTCTNCTSKQVSSGPTTTTQPGTTTTSQSGGGTTTTTGQSGVSGCRKEDHVCTQLSSCCEGLTCVAPFGLIGTCKKIVTTTSTVIVTTSTTEEISKELCPLDCCIDEEKYYDKACPADYNCEQNQCVLARTGSKLFYYIIILILVMIVIALFLFFVFRRGEESDLERFLKSK